MENIIEKYYYNSVKGIDEGLLRDNNGWYNYVLNLPIAQQIVYTIILFHSQVENGGLHQYFFNSYGQFVFLTLKNLKLVGAIKRHAILNEALTIINDDKKEEVHFRKLIFNRKLKKIRSFEQKIMPI